MSAVASLSPGEGEDDVNVNVNAPTNAVVARGHYSRNFRPKSEWRANSVHDAVRVNVDELSKAILPVVWPNEPTFNTCCFPLSAHRLGVGDVNVYDTPAPSTVVWSLCDEVQLHPAPLDEAVLRGLVQFGCKAQASIAREGSVEVVHGKDGSDAFEDHLSHDETKVDLRRTASNRKLLCMRPQRVPGPPLP